MSSSFENLKIQVTLDKSKRKRTRERFDEGIFESDLRYRRVNVKHREHRTSLDYYEDVYYTSRFFGFIKTYYSSIGGNVVSVPKEVRSYIRKRTDFVQDTIVELREEGLQAIDKMLKERTIV